MSVAPGDRNPACGQSLEASEGIVVSEFEWTRESAVAALGAVILPSAVLQEGMGQAIGADVLAIRVSDTRMIVGGKDFELRTEASRYVFQSLVLAHELGPIALSQMTALNPRMEKGDARYALKAMRHALCRAAGRTLISTQGSASATRYILECIRFEDLKGTSPDTVPPGLLEFYRPLIDSVKPVKRKTGPKPLIKVDDDPEDMPVVAAAPNSLVSARGARPAVSRPGQTLIQPYEGPVRAVRGSNPRGKAANSDWRHRSLCKDEDPELFHPVGTNGRALLKIAEAKTVCRRCPVVSECLTWALESGQDSGVWGGMSEDERRALRRRNARNRARTA